MISIDALKEFLQGGTSVASIGVGVAFLRMWRAQRDRFFLHFAIAFWIFAASRAYLAVMDPEGETATYAFIGRLLAFLVILFAIYDKNRARSRVHVAAA